jgi:hypothetical protein
LKSKQKRIRTDRLYRRATQHAFIPSMGHPTLCAACNAGPDDLHRGKVIHVAPRTLTASPVRGMHAALVD